MTTLEKFHWHISRLYMYPKNSIYVDKLLEEMASNPIVRVGKYFIFIIILRSRKVVFVRKNKYCRLDLFYFHFSHFYNQMNYQK